MYNISVQVPVKLCILLTTEKVEMSDYLRGKPSILHTKINLICAGSTTPHVKTGIILVWAWKWSIYDR